MKILLAGGAGYIGSLLAPYLTNLGHAIDIIDLLWFGNFLPSNITLIQKDLLACAEEDLCDYDQIIFLAGISNDPMADYDLKNNFIYNAALPPLLAHRAKNAGVKRFIYASSCTVYGNTGDQESSEHESAIPVYPYGTAKLQGELGAQSIAGEDFSVISLRQGSISGVSPRMRFDLFINTMFANAYTKQKIVVRNATLWRPFLDITDTLEAYRLALEADQSMSGIFNVATSHCTVLDAAKSVASFFEKYGLNVELDIGYAQDSRSYKMNLEKARIHLGFSSQGSIERVLDELYAKRDTFGDFFQKKYWNIEAYKQLLQETKQDTQ